MTKEAAQARTDQIRAFRDELRALESEGVVALDPGPRARVQAHHDGLLEELAAAWDVDVSGRQKQLSLGLRIVAFLGAAAMSAAVALFFRRIWGHLDTPVQVLLLVAAPLAGLGLVAFAARRDRSGYFATIAGLVAFACFVVDLALLGDVFNLTPTQNAFLAWGAFGLALAYGYDLRLLLIAGILSLLAYLTATTGTWHGAYWLSAGERPEHYILAGLAVLALSYAPHGGRTAFPGTYRLFGLLAIFVAVLVLSNWGEASLLPFSPGAVEHLYQVAGFAVSAAVIWAGVHFHWPGTTNLGSTFFALFLYTRFYDWWWEWMPRYLFFLVVALVAVLLLLVLQRVRHAAREVAP
jgi:uncharacterized membrane protein